jgi:hypothetical protein
MNLREVGRGILWFGTGLALLAAAIFLLNARIGQRPDLVTIRSYPVAPEIAGEMRSALAEALSTATERGRVSLTSDGRLLVTAPESLQRGVESILSEVAAKQPAPTPSIHFEIWLVSAAPGTATRSENGPGLMDLSPVFADLQKSQGPLQFDLIEKVALQVRAGNDDSAIQGAYFGVHVAPTVRHDSKGDPVIAARINLEINPPFSGRGIPRSLKALAELRPGQLLELGQSGLPGKPNGDPTPTAQVYYIVRASL